MPKSSLILGLNQFPSIELLIEATGRLPRTSVGTRITAFRGSVWLMRVRCCEVNSLCEESCNFLLKLSDSLSHGCEQSHRISLDL